MIIEKVDGEAMLINLDQLKAFDRVDLHFLEVVLSTVKCKPCFHSWICLLYASLIVMVEVNGVKLKIFILSKSIHQSHPLLPLLYVLTLELFLCKLRVNLVLGGITLPGAVTYVNDIFTLVMSIAKIDKVRREIWTYETETGVTINCDKLVRLKLVSWNLLQLWKDIIKI